MPSYSLSHFKYGQSGDAGTTGGTVSWALDSTVPAFFASVMTKAFNAWSSHADIQFKQVDSSASPLITISAKPIDGLGHDVAQSSTSYHFFSQGQFKDATSGKIVFDSDEKWHVSGNDVVSDNGTSLLSIALTEVGYAIGLNFNGDQKSLLALIPGRELKDLGQTDIDGAQFIYGPPSQQSYLIDENYYYSHYGDVKSSNLGPIEHYDSFGWHEGRDPSAYFSTFGYLAANPDVARSGIAPLRHYDQYGWKEGRDPNVKFDNELYLLHNPDVKAAGIDPLLHYMQSGRAEGRQTYDAIGKAENFNHGSFDAEYYLLANPDVAQVALKVGGDTFAFAYQHYESNGWKEGRKANAFFDPSYYLAHNSDVAAAHIDPLTHYDRFGWKEGRNPSATFDTHSYLAANSDVAAAHIDPLLHYLQFGANEGRHLV